MAIESIIQSEFAGDHKRIYYLTAQLNDNPLVERLCRSPLNLAIVCNLCRSNDTEPLPNTTTELCAKFIWTIVAASTRSTNLSSHCDLSEELQQSWWYMCELAFRNIEKGHDMFSKSEFSVFSSKEISYFGLIKPISELESSDNISLPFLHPHFEEYLAALHLARQPQKAQFGFMRQLMADVECDFKTTTTFWHFFISNYVCVIANVDPDIILQVF